jgi:hypothetical protein
VIGAATLAAMADTYALYAWGNFIYETELDRGAIWLEPAVLRGERILEDDDLTMNDTGPLPIDVSRSLFETGDEEYVEGRDFRDTGAEWRVGYLRLATDGTLADATRLAEELQENAELGHDPAPSDNPVPVGEVVATWEDPHGQWDMALVRL